MEKLVSIIIPVYNRREEILVCLRSLSQINYKNVEIIIVDNGSDDQTQEAIKQEFSRIIIIRNEENLMASPARNQGFMKAKGDYILFLDSDNKVSPDFLTEMVNLAEIDEKIGLVGPKMFCGDRENVIWYAGADINMLSSKTTYIGINNYDRGQFDQIREVQHIPNCSLIKREVLDKIGLWNESYVMSYEEPDLSLRAKRVGYKIVFCPSAKIWHMGQISNTQSKIGFRSPKRAYYFARNRVVFMRQHANFLSFIIFFTTFFPVLVLLHFLIFARQRKWAILEGYMSGCFDGFIYGLTGHLRDSTNNLVQQEVRN